MSYWPITQITDPNVSEQALVSVLRGIRVFQQYRLVGKSFGGLTKDTNFWTETVTGSGSVTQSGEIVLDTGATANSTVKYQTNCKARYIASNANEARCTLELTTAGTVNNLRRFGAYSVDGSDAPDDGVYFEFNGATLSACHAVAGVVTTVSSGSFNGLHGATFAPGTSLHRYAIQYTMTGAIFIVDDTLLHNMSFSGTKLGVSYDFPYTIQNINSGDLASSVQMAVSAANIGRQGAAQSEPVARNITAAGTYVLKYGAGRLHTVILGGAGSANSNIRIYDDTTGLSNLRSTIDTSKVAVPMDLLYDMHFDNGLKVVVTNTVEATFSWE